MVGPPSLLEGRGAYVLYDLSLPGEGCQDGVPLVTHQDHCNPAPLTLPLKIQQRRQELEQSLVVRNT